jgi:hypothetical protein
MYVCKAPDGVIGMQRRIVPGFEGDIGVRARMKNEE